jgi:hypothetical protein
MFKITPEKRVLFVRRVTPVALALFGVFSFAVANLRHTPVAHADPIYSNTVNFQARLQTAAGAVVPDSSYNIQFKLYDASTGGTALWTETYLNNEGNGLNTVNGYFSAQLGGRAGFPSDINWSHQLWITMNVGGPGNSASWDGEMNPRMALTAIPYAFQANQLIRGNDAGTYRSLLNMQAPTNGDQNFVIQDQGAQGTYNILTANQNDSRYIQLQSGAIGAASQQVGNFFISGTGKFNGSLQVQNDIQGSGNISTSDGALVLGGTTRSSYITPLGTSIYSKINVANIDPGAYGQVIALGITSASSSTSRVLTVLDPRSGDHQASIALLDPSESQVFGLSWDGSTTTPVIKTSTSTLGFYSGSAIGATLYSTTGVSVWNVGLAQGTNGYVQFSNTTNNSNVSIGASTVSSTYTLNLPTAQGTVNQCLGVASISGSTMNTGYRNCASTLQDAYNNAGVFADIQLNSTGGGIAIQDASTSVGGNLFMVQNNAANTNYFSVDTTGAQVTGKMVVNGDQTISGTLGIGTTSATRQLQVTTNTSATSALPVMLEQLGSGNTGIEVKNSAQSYYIGLDSSDNTFKINSSTAAANTGNANTTTMGAAAVNNGFTDSGDGAAIVGTQFVAPASGTITTLSGYVASPIDGTNNKGRMAIYSDSGLGGATDYDNMRPGTLLAASTETTLTGNAWNNFTISSTSVTAGTRYWLVYITNTSNSANNNLKGGDNLNAHGTVYMSNTYNSGAPGFPSNWSGSSTYEGEYAVRATITTSGFTPDGTGSFNDSVLKISAAGQATFRNTSNSTTAFAIQSANSTSLFNVDTSNEQVRIGPASGDGLGALLILGNKTSTGDPTYVAGAMYYNSYSNSFRCAQGGVWMNCIGGLLTVNTALGAANANNTNVSSTSEKTFNQTYSLPANYCANNRVIRVTANGTMNFTAQPTLQLRIKLDNTSIAVSDSSTSLPTGTNVTGKGWSSTFTIMCPNAPSSNATVYAQGVFNEHNITNQLPYTSTAGIATDGALTLGVSTQWGASSANNSITLQSLMIEGMGQ